MTRISPWDDIPQAPASPPVASRPATPRRPAPSAAAGLASVTKAAATGIPPVIPIPVPIPGPWEGRPSADTPDAMQRRAVMADRLNLPPAPRIIRTDFFGAIAKNQRNTLLLGFFFTLLLASVGYALGGTMDYYSGEISRTGTAPHALAGAAIMVGVSAIWILFALMFGDRVVLKMSGAHEITHDEHPMLDNVVTEMAMAAGIPKPRVFIMETEALNAFATGMTPEKSAVAVTRGLLRKLKREELQGVIAHEIGHIVNDDIRYATMLAVAVGILFFVCEMVRRAPRFISLGGSGKRRGGKGSGAAVLVLVAIYIFIAILAPILAKILQASISRQREYMADATSVKLTRNPTGLITALQKVDQAAAAFQGSSAAFQHMYFINPYKRFTETSLNLFSTHPPTTKRIERLANLG